MGDLLGRLGLDPAPSSQRAIARQLSIARDTVASALASDGPPKYERAAAPSAISEIEPRIRALLTAYPGMPATVIAERVGWSGSISWFRERVRAIRPEYLTADPVIASMSLPVLPSAANSSCASCGVERRQHHSASIVRHCSKQGNAAATSGPNSAGSQPPRTQQQEKHPVRPPAGRQTHR